ncbi:MAG: hypothetical protein B7C24_12835 [Bacteroidetes bacterium 4572_77]|nr:MAG: hypothetical protein B7C24_12835 [Bacteroidetes bacterium 4572_77]
MKEQSPFVLYRNPKEEICYYLPDKQAYSLNSWKELLDDAFVFAPFVISTKNPIWVFNKAKQSEIKPSAIRELKIQANPNSQTIPYIASKNEYKDNLKAIKDKIVQGAINKAVLSRIVEVENKHIDLSLLFLQLTEKYPQAFVYLLRLPDGQLWCGASPELLADYNEDNLKTMALAGTQLINNRRLEDIKWETKEIEEHSWVEKHLEEIFLKHEIASQKKGRYTSAAGKIAHLRSDYQLNCATSMATGILQELHPTPAVCGTPTTKAKDIILEQEQHSSHIG